MKKCKRSYQDEFHFREVAMMIRSLDAESDRAVVLIVTSWIDDALTELLKRRLIRDETIQAKLFDRLGPLGTFSGKISMSYLMGCISKTVYQNLEIIRGLRNIFAHDRTSLSFEAQGVRARCQKLFLKGFEGSVDSGFEPRQSFIATGIGILGFFIEFVSAATMSDDREKDFFPDFMKHMARKTPSMVAQFCGQEVVQGKESPDR